MSQLDIFLFITCIIVYIALISYCAYGCRDKTNENASDYVEVFEV